MIGQSQDVASHGRVGRAGGLRPEVARRRPGSQTHGISAAFSTAAIVGVSDQRATRVHRSRTRSMTRNATRPTRPRFEPPWPVAMPDPT